MTRLDIEVNLIENLQKGDLAVLPELIQLYQKQALSWAMQIVHDSYLAEDVVQEAFLQMQHKIASFKGFEQVSRLVSPNDSSTGY